MADYTPPTEELPIFDSSVFLSGDEPLTYNQAKKKFLRYPNAQGTENLQAINVNGTATFNSGVVMNEGASVLSNLANPLFIVDKTTTTNKTAEYQSGSTFTIDNNVNNGTIICKTNNSSGADYNVLTLNSANSIFQTAGTITLQSNVNYINGPIYTNSVLEMNGLTANDRAINNVYYQLKDDQNLNQTDGTIYASSGSFIYDNNINSGSHIFATNNSSGTQTTVLTLNSNNMTIATVNPPTQTAVQPASNDSSTKIPTTAWVQSAITASIPATPFVPKFVNYSDIQSNITSLTFSAGPTINFNGTWAQNDIAIFRITNQLSYAPDGNGAYQSTGNSLGVILVRPYYMYPNWANTTTTLCNYTLNAPTSICAADRHICYFTPSYNIGQQSFFLIYGTAIGSGVGGTMSFACLYQGNPSSWTYNLSIEYLMSRTTNGTITISNGTGTNSINNQLK